MRNRRERDDSNINRLSSFLYKKGMLNVEKIKRIKNDVFYIVSERNEFILKKHYSSSMIDQQWQFFNQLKKYPEIVPFNHFPNGKRLLIDKESGYFTISPFIKGEKLTYKKAKDREEAIIALNSFHMKATNIDISQRIKKEPFIHRWYNRLSMFKESQSLFEYFGSITLFNDIVQTTLLRLKYISELNWQAYEKKAIKERCWIHGDVASHNFIKNNSTNTTYLIDFDLLAVSSQIHDYIQLGQRFLPYINWNLNQLLAYNMVPEEQCKYWLSALIVPTDLLREWMYFVSKDVHLDNMEKYIARMEEEWLERRYFLNKASSVLKSI